MRRANLIFTSIIGIVLGVWLLGGVAPSILELPKDYSLNIEYFSTNKEYDFDKSKWSEQLVSKSIREDKTIDSRDDHIIIESNFHVENLLGETLFSFSETYDVNQASLKAKNLNEENEKNTYFRFPPFVKKQNYHLINTDIIGAVNLEYKRSEPLKGLNTYVFGFDKKNIDETAGYSRVNGVPEEYGVLTDTWGSMWVEPVTGRIVKFENFGNGTRVNKTTLKRDRIFTHWSKETIEVDILRSVKEAEQKKSLYYILYVLGGFSLIFGIFSLLLFPVYSRKK